MKKLNFRIPVRISFAILVAGAIVIGCSKKQAATPPLENASTNVAAVSVPIPAPTPKMSPPQAPVDPSEVAEKMSEAKAALTTHDYQKADEALSVPQKTISALTANQLAAYNSAKNSLAQSVVAAANAGDPNAKAVLQKMYQEH
jgi:hypothetical protein